MSETTNFVIPAEAHTDDHRIEVKFDAVHWFRQASRDSLVRLALCGWRGDYPADAVAEWEAERNAEVARLFEYLRIVNAPRTVCGFECVIDEAAALEWLKNNAQRGVNPQAQLRYCHTLTENNSEVEGKAEVVFEADSSWASISVWDKSGQQLADVAVELHTGKLVGRMWKTEDLDADPTIRVELCDNPNR